MDKKDSNWIIKLREIEPFLGEQEKAVVELIKRNPKDFLNLSIAEIAKESKTSQSTVVRFCRHLGYSGLKEFKISLSSEGRAIPKIINNEILYGDSIELIVNKVFSGCMASLKSSFSCLDLDSIDKACEEMKNAKNIDIYGQGGSASVAKYFSHQLMKVGVRNNFYSDSLSSRLSYSQFTENEVVVIISTRGENKDLLKVAEKAKSLGVKIILITDFPKSSIGLVADIVLKNSGGVFFEEDQNTFSRTSQLATVDILYMGLTMKLGIKAVDAINRRVNNEY
ncbi:MAG: MurR/RpiR family transcriptional regulator [Sphaerochaetaceae bacterium]